MTTRIFKKGQLVKSLKGRDAGRYFLICGWDENFVYIVDGELRRIQKPKKKNIGHLWYTNYISDEVNHKFEAEKKVTNADIKAALITLLEKLDMN